MTIKELASKIAKVEGKKSQARIGDIREILSILADIAFSVPAGKTGTISDPLHVLWYLGRNRAKRKKK